MRTDVSIQADLDELYSVVRKKAGRIDVLVANAGGAVPERLGEITEEAIDATFGANVKGTIFTVQKALPLLSDGASIVVTGSSSTVRPETGLEVYGASKAAVRNLVRSWALSAQERKFRVNALSPGPTETPGLIGAVGPDHQLASGCRSAGSAARTRSPRSRRSWPRTLPASSTAPTGSSTEGRRRSETEGKRRSEHAPPGIHWAV